MGLYLCILGPDDDEVDGLEVGSYEDWGKFRDAVRALGDPSRFPLLLDHSDSDGEWTPLECEGLERELASIEREFRSTTPSLPVRGTWQYEVARSMGIQLKSLFESFFDVDGEPIIDRLRRMARTAQEMGSPILFQ